MPVCVERDQGRFGSIFVFPNSVPYLYRIIWSMKERSRVTIERLVDRFKMVHFDSIVRYLVF